MIPEVSIKYSLQDCSLLPQERTLDDISMTKKFYELDFPKFYVELDVLFSNFKILTDKKITSDTLYLKLEVYLKILF